MDERAPAEVGPPRDGAAVRFPPPVLPLLTICAGVGLQYLLPLVIGPPAPLRYLMGGLLVVASILVLGLWPVVLFRRSGQSEIPWRPTPSIIEVGPYRYTRNPMYLQMILVCIGVSTMLANGWILLLVPLCVGALQRFAIAPEEAYLSEKFGQEYRDYMRRVRRWL